MASSESSCAGCDRLQQLCSRFSTHPVVQQVVYGYERTKHSSQFAEHAFGALENGARRVVNYATPLYDHYCQPMVAATLSTYTKGVEFSNSAMETTRGALVSVSTWVIAATVLIAQLNVALGAAAADLLFDCAIATKRFGLHVLSSAKCAEKAMEHRLIDFIQHAHCVAQVPMEKMSVQANKLVDVVGATVDTALGLRPELDPPGCTLGERITRIARRVSFALSSRAHGEVLDPLYTQMHTLADHLAKSLVLVEAVRERGAWAAEKVVGWHASLNEVKLRVENEAVALKQKPEEVLLRMVRQSSDQLSTKLATLRKKGPQVLSESAVAYLDAAITYLSKLEQSVGEVNDVYELRNEVLLEARTKLSDLAEFTSKWLHHEDRSTNERNEKGDSNSDALS